MVLDAQLPVVDEPTFVEAARRCAYTATTPIIAISAAPAGLDQCQRFGVTARLAKSRVRVSGQVAKRSLRRRRRRHHFDRLPRSPETAVEALNPRQARRLVGIGALAVLGQYLLDRSEEDVEIEGFGERLDAVAA